MTETKTKKDELFDDAQSRFGKKLDRRLTLAQLKDQVERLDQEDQNPTPEVKAPVPLKVKNVITGNIFDYNELFAGNSDLMVIEWES